MPLNLWQSVCSHFSVYSVQRLLARQLAGDVTMVNLYLIIVLWATSKKRGRRLSCYQNSFRQLQMADKGSYPAPKGLGRITAAFCFSMFSVASTG